MKSPFKIERVDGVKYAKEINEFNALFPDAFKPLKPRHLEEGFWWLVYDGESAPIAFAGLVPFHPFPKIGYLKRAAVLSSYRGQGLQKQLMDVREYTARMEGWTHIVSECEIANIHSANNFIRAGYLLVEAERPWDKDMLVWRKEIT